MTGMSTKNHFVLKWFLVVDLIKLYPNSISKLITLPEFLLELTNPSFQFINFAFQFHGIVPFGFKLTNKTAINDDFLLAFVNA